MISIVTISIIFLTVLYVIRQWSKRMSRERPTPWDILVGIAVIIGVGIELYNFLSANFKVNGEASLVFGFIALNTVIVAWGYLHRNIFFLSAFRGWLKLFLATYASILMVYVVQFLDYAFGFINIYTAFVTVSLSLFGMIFFPIVIMRAPEEKKTSVTETEP